MRHDTGFTAADAQDDFQRARRRQLMSQPIVAHRYVIMRTHEWSEDILARLRESDLDRKR